MRFIFFTKTEWNEPPRLRHQLAELLVTAGYDVIFFQNPVYPWQNISSNFNSLSRIHLYRHKQLLHHKLRIHPILHMLNARYEKNKIFHVIKKLDIQKKDIIVNFNYDYFFLIQLFPNNKIVSIVNDNFWSRAIGGFEKPLKWALKKTCISSTEVLTVSLPLIQELKQFCNPILFYPWTSKMYVPPSSNSKRNKLLFWGYINYKLDLNRVLSLANSFLTQRLDYKLIFVGPHNPNEEFYRKLKDHPLIDFKQSTPLNELCLDEFIATIIPYRHNIKDIDAITFPNKMLNLLVHGLPIIVTGMPEFIEVPFVFRLPESNEDAHILINKVKDNFLSLQPEISNFVSMHTSEKRMQQFLNIVES